MENHLAAIGMIHRDGNLRRCMRTRPEGAHDRDARHRRLRREALLDLDFSGKHTRELLGERDLSMADATAVIGRGIGKPDLPTSSFLLTSCSRC